MKQLDVQTIAGSLVEIMEKLSKIETELTLARQSIKTDNPSSKMQCNFVPLSLEKVFSTPEMDALNENVKKLLSDGINGNLTKVPKVAHNRNQRILLVWLFLIVVVLATGMFKSIDDKSDYEVELSYLRRINPLSTHLADSLVKTNPARLDSLSKSIVIPAKAIPVRKKDKMHNMD